MICFTNEDRLKDEEFRTDDLVCLKLIKKLNAEHEKIVRRVWYSRIHERSGYINEQRKGFEKAIDIVKKHFGIPNKSWHKS